MPNYDGRRPWETEVSFTPDSWNTNAKVERIPVDLEMLEGVVYELRSDHLFHCVNYGREHGLNETQLGFLKETGIRFSHQSGLEAYLVLDGEGMQFIPLQRLNGEASQGKKGAIAVVSNSLGNRGGEVCRILYRGLVSREHDTGEEESELAEEEDKSYNEAI